MDRRDTVERDSFNTCEPQPESHNEDNKEMSPKKYSEQIAKPTETSKEQLLAAKVLSEFQQVIKSHNSKDQVSSNNNSMH